MISSAILFCGCAVTRWGETVHDARFCYDHEYLFSPDKTINELADLVWAVARGEHLPIIEVEEKRAGEIWKTE